MLKIILSLTFCLAFQLESYNFQSTTDNSIEQFDRLLNRLEDQSRAIINERIVSSDDVAKFQVDVLKKRNFNCASLEDLTDFGKNDLEASWQNDLLSYSDSELKKFLNEKVC